MDTRNLWLFLPSLRPLWQGPAHGLEGFYPFQNIYLVHQTQKVNLEFLNPSVTGGSQKSNFLPSWDFGSLHQLSSLHPFEIDRLPAAPIEGDWVWSADRSSVVGGCLFGRSHCGNTESLSTSQHKPRLPSASYLALCPNISLSKQIQGANILAAYYTTFWREKRQNTLLNCVRFVWKYIVGCSINEKVDNKVKEDFHFVVFRGTYGNKR